ncbi:unnamed protein product, partial [Polarella glacialis]
SLSPRIGSATSPENRPHRTSPLGAETPTAGTGEPEPRRGRGKSKRGDKDDSGQEEVPTRRSKSRSLAAQEGAPGAASSSSAPAPNEAASSAGFQASPALAAALVAVVASAEATAAGSALGGPEEGEGTAPSRPARQARASTTGAPQDQLTESQSCLVRSLRNSAQAERRQDREWVCREGRRLGRFRRGLVGTAVDKDAAVQWEGGLEAEELEAMRVRIVEQKQQVEDLKKSQKPKKAAQVLAPAAASGE